MIEWKEIHSHDEIPSGRDANGRIQNFLAIHRSTRYTSDTYMIWKESGGEIPRWPHPYLPITHIAEINLPTQVEAKPGWQKEPTGGLDLGIYPLIDTESR